MTKYRVYLTKIVEIGITVEADDPEAAVEAAHDEGVSGICAQCSGWGQSWTRDESDEMETEYVFEGDDASGDEVWSSGERWTRVSDR